MCILLWTQFTYLLMATVPRHKVISDWFHEHDTEFSVLNRTHLGPDITGDSQHKCAPKKYLQELCDAIMNIACGVHGIGESRIENCILFLMICSVNVQLFNKTQFTNILSWRIVLNSISLCDPTFLIMRTSCILPTLCLYLYSSLVRGPLGIPFCKLSSFCRLWSSTIWH